MHRSSTTISSDSKCQSHCSRGSFPVVYGVELKDALAHEDLAIGSYRFSVSQLIPEMTQVALRTHQKDMMRETPDFSKQKFLYRLSRSEYENEWGKDYKKPGFGTRVLSVLLRFHAENRAVQGNVI